MSEHKAVLSEEMIRALPSKISRIAQGVLLAIGIASTAISISGEWSEGHKILKEFLFDEVQVMGCSLHLLLILLVLFPGRIHPLNDDVRDPTVRILIKSLNTFYLRAWTWFWMWLGLLYVAILYTALQQVMSSTGVLVATVVMDVCNIANTYFIYMGFVFLSPRFFRACAAKARSGQQLTSTFMDQLSMWQPTAMVITLAAMSAVIYLRLQSAKDPASESSGLRDFPSLAIGLAAALAIAHFVGRVDSKFIFNWRWVVGILFLWAAVQTYTPVLYQENDPLKAVFTYSVFTMKCVLFMFVSNFFESRGVVYYATELVETGERLV